MDAGVLFGRLAGSHEIGPGCEPISHGFFREPISAWSSLVFVVAGVVIVLLARERRAGRGRWPAPDVVEPPSLGYAALVAGIGLGSVAQHGPNPVWADLAHDLPLLGTLVLITVDAIADLVHRPRVWWWWALPTAAIAPIIHWAPAVGDATQGAVAAVAVLVNLYRARRRPALRRPILWTVALLALGGILEILSSPGWPLCYPGTWWYGHAAWHLCVAAGLAVLAGALGWRHVVSEEPAPEAEVPLG